MLRSLAVLLLATSACMNNAPVEAAPSDFDGNVHFIWDHYDSGSDRELVDAVNKLHTIVKGDTRTDPKMGGITHLSSGDLQPVTVPAGTDPSKARGMYLINEFACTLDKLTSIVIGTNQDVVHPGTYDSYARTYTSDVDAFKSGTAPTLTWSQQVRVSVLDAKLSESSSGGVRKVVAPTDDPTAFGAPLLLARAWLPTPGVFDQPGPIFDQNYEVEVYYERKPGEMIHVYPVWRHMEIPAAGLSTDDDGVVNIITQDLQQWDAQTATMCGM
jgi:hypothetical protein